jgi:basic membrane protein A
MKQTSWIGQTLNKRYQIQELLGQGGMSAVYKAFDPNLRRTVAIKMVHPHLSSDESFIKRFMEEAAAIASLRHPNIVQVFDFNSDEDINYMVMENLPGETLQARLQRLNKNQRKMTIDEAVQITMNVCDGLNYAHKRGMVHRDIKPANIMLDINNQAILMDFGIVKIVGSAAHTLTGAVIGTANYMAPEIIRSEPADQRSDIYSLGITCYEMLGGSPPFEADSAMTIMMMHLNDPIPNLEQIRDDLPKDLVNIVYKMLTKDRKDRYQTVDELSDDLRKLTQKITTNELETPESERSQSDQAEINISTQIISPPGDANNYATLVETPENTKRVDEIPATLIEIPEKTQIKERIGKKKRINWGVVGLISGLLVITAIVIIGISTSWFGFSEQIGVVKPGSTATSQIMGEEPTNKQNTLVTQATIHPEDGDNLKATELAEQMEKEKFLVCLLTDTGSLAGSPFLENAFMGIKRAQDELGVRGEYLESNDESQYEMHLNQFIEMRCGLIISAGYMLGDITIRYAEMHPDTKFSILDFAENGGLPNLMNSVYQIDQASFMAGYLAAAMTKTQTVATYGGMPIPPVEMFMDGFARGVQFYNEAKGKNVRVIGWNMENQGGRIFIDSFDNQGLGEEIANEFLSQSADIIYPVAGSAGLGSAAAVMNHGSGYIIGVDSDWAEKYPEFAPILLTSSIKRMDQTIFALIQVTMEGNFGGERYVGNLENEGVGLAPFHDSEATIPGEVKVELEEIRELIISGQIEFNPIYQYK